MTVTAVASTTHEEIYRVEEQAVGRLDLDLLPAALHVAGARGGEARELRIVGHLQLAAAEDLSGERPHKRKAPAAYGLERSATEVVDRTRRVAGQRSR